MSTSKLGRSIIPANYTSTKLTPKYQYAADFISERKLLFLAFIK
jgi:hypothetical protein